jgi:hypothetical protein
MPSDERAKTIYATRSQWKILDEIKKRTGKSRSKILFLALDFWLKNNPKDMKDLVKDLEEVKKDRQARENERFTGDYLGSFDKEQNKIARIEKEVKDPVLKEIMIKQVRQDYETTRKVARRKIFQKELSAEGVTKPSHSVRIRAENVEDEKEKRLKSARMKMFKLIEDNYDVIRKDAEEHGISWKEAYDTSGLSDKSEEKGTKKKKRKGL